MNKHSIISKIVLKKEFSQLPKKDVEKVYEKFERRQTSDEDKIKLTRDLLRKVYSVFTSEKLLNKNILDKKTPAEILKKHISTRERFKDYPRLYSKLLKDFKEKEISFIDLGAGVNGLSYNFFPKNKKINYLGIEAVGQLVGLMNYYFDTLIPSYSKGHMGARDGTSKNKIFGKAIHESLFNLNVVKKTIRGINGKKIVCLFKVVDSLEMVEKNYSKKLLNEIVPLVDLVVVSFATKSLVSKKIFNAKRYWFENFVKENFLITEDFELSSERYFVFKKR